MTLQTSTFTKLAGLGEDYGRRLLQLEQSEPVDLISVASLASLDTPSMMAALQSFSEKIHIWYPILDAEFSDCVSSCLENALSRSTDTFLLLMVLASGAIAQEPEHSEALRNRPDAVYLNPALSMLHLVVLEQSLRSVQCLAAASIHHYMLLKPVQAHNLAVTPIRKAQDLRAGGAFEGSAQHKLENWLRTYRAAMLVESELAIPFCFAETDAWEREDNIPVATGSDVWTFEANSPSPLPTTPGSIIATDSGGIVTYFLTEIAMRRMLRRHTTSVSASSDGTVEYAPLIARELEAQIEQWYSFLPESLRFPRDLGVLDAFHRNRTLSPHAVSLCTQYWAYYVSIYWPSIVKVMGKQDRVGEKLPDECKHYFHSYQQFILSAKMALGVCLPNKWTIYAR